MVRSLTEKHMTTFPSLSTKRAIRALSSYARVVTMILSMTRTRRFRVALRLQQIGVELRHSFHRRPGIPPIDVRLDRRRGLNGPNPVIQVSAVPSVIGCVMGMGTSREFNDTAKSFASRPSSPDGGRILYAPLAVHVAACSATHAGVEYRGGVSEWASCVRPHKAPLIS